MKILTFFLTVLIFPLCLFSQEQVSNIQNIIQNDWFHKKGFTFIDGTEYLIEWSHDLTKISTIFDQQVELLHEIDYKPDTKNSMQWGDFRTHNSSLIIDENKLFEVYTKHIVVFDIVSGKVVDHFDFSQENVEIFYDFTIHENFYVFQSRSGIYYRFDRISEQLEKISITESTLSYPINDRIYTLSEDKTSLLYYDILSGEELTFITNNVKFKRINYINSENSNALFLTDENGKAFKLTHDHQFEEITCIDASITELGVVYFNDEILSFESLQNGEHRIHVINIKDCEEITTINTFHPEWFGSILYYDNKLRDKDYLMFSKPGGLFDWGEHFIIDLLNNKYSSLPNLSDYADFLMPKEVIRKDSFVYMKAFNEVDFHPFIYSLIRFNLNNLDFELISITEGNYPDEFVLGEYDGSNQLSIFIESSTTRDIWEYDLISTESTHLKNLYYPINLGIRYLTEFFNYQEDLLFFVAGGIYKMTSESISKIMDVDWVSGMTLYGENLCFLARQDFDHYTVKLNLSDYSIDSTYLEGFGHIDYRRPRTDYAIINVPNSYDQNTTGYFDIRQNKWKQFKYQGQNIWTIRFTLSGNNILLSGWLGSSNNPHQQFLFDSKNRTMEIIDEFEDLYPNTLPDNEGGFYMLPHSSNSYKDLKKINPDGSVHTIYEDMTEKIYQQEYVALDGPVKTIPMQGEDEVLFISERDEEIIQYRIQYDGTLYYIPFFYKEVEDILIAHLGNNDQKQCYFVRYGEDAFSILPETENDELLDVIFEEDRLVLFFYDDEKFTIRHYDLINETLEEGISVDCAKEQSYHFFEKYIKINPDQYLLSFSDGISGKEPWIYDYKERTLEALTDLYPGHIGSEPENFISYDGYVYFTALDPLKIRQWFRWDGLDELKKVSTEEGSINIFPNPSSGFVILDIDADEIVIYNESGTECKKIMNYESGNKIDTYALPNGAYFILVKSDRNGSLVSKFQILKN